MQEDEGTELNPMTNRQRTKPHATLKVECSLRPRNEGAPPHKVNNSASASTGTSQMNQHACSQPPHHWRGRALLKIKVKRTPPRQRRGSGSELAQEEHTKQYKRRQTSSHKPPQVTNPTNSTIGMRPPLRQAELSLGRFSWPSMHALDTTAQPS